MQYRYRFTTYRRIAGCVEFDEFFEAIQYMNKHYDDCYSIRKAEILDLYNDNKVVCSKRKKL